MSATVAAIYRYPVKGLSAERLDRVALMPGECTRCAATQVNPVTAKRDVDIVAALGRTFGHINMGVYAEVVAGGEVALGDAPQASSTGV